MVITANGRRDLAFSPSGFGWWFAARLNNPEDTEKALETIEPTKLLGVVMNEASMRQVGYDECSKGYGKIQQID
jgi:hypothetical protein